MGNSGVVRFKVKRRKDNDGGLWEHNYYGYFHHSTGGGQTMGGALNRTEKLSNIVEGCDFYCSFHAHKLSHARSTIYKANPRSRKVEKRDVDFITCGSYLDYDGYPEAGMLRPSRLGSPIITLSNKLEVAL